MNYPWIRHCNATIDFLLTPLPLTLNDGDQCTEVYILIVNMSHHNLSFCHQICKTFDIYTQHIKSWYTVKVRIIQTCSYRVKHIHLYLHRKLICPQKQSAPNCKISNMNSCICAHVISKSSCKSFPCKCSRMKIPNLQYIIRVLHAWYWYVKGYSS